jgi:hypothetical protein
VAEGESYFDRVLDVASGKTGEEVKVRSHIHGDPIAIVIVEYVELTQTINIFYVLLCAHL